MSKMQLESRAVLFDLDGTLVDSAASIAASWRQWAGKHGIDWEAAMKRTHGMRIVESIPMLLPNVELDKEVTDLENIECMQTDGLISFLGAKELLSMLPQNRWAIVTSGGIRVATHRIKYTGLSFPHVLISANDVSNGKPHPEAYLKAASMLDIKPADCLVVEDAPAGIKAARAAGMKVVAVVTTHQPKDLIDADYCVAQLSDLQLTVQV